MTRPVKAMAGEHPVEAAIREGKITESRRAHYMQLMAKRPKATTKLLAKLAAVLQPPEEMEAVRQYVQSGGQAAAAASTASGPTEYLTEGLNPGEIGRPQSGQIIFEDLKAAVGAFSPELM